MKTENFIAKHFIVRDWCSYQECDDIGNVIGMQEASMSTITGGRVTDIKTWLDANGNGFELRRHYLSNEEIKSALLSAGRENNNE
jgi:hypothetical protein